MAMPDSTTAKEATLPPTLPSPAVTAIWLTMLTFVALRVLHREQHHSRDDEGHEDPDGDEDGIEPAIAGGIGGMVCCLLTEVGADIPAPIEEHDHERAGGEGARGIPELQPGQGGRLHRPVHSGMNEGRNRHDGENAEFHAGHEHLHLAGESDARDQHDADGEVAQAAERGGGDEVGRERGIDDVHQVGAEREAARDDEHQGGDQHRPAGKEPPERAEALGCPVEARAGARHDLVQAFIGDRDTQHRHSEDEQRVDRDGAGGRQQHGGSSGDGEARRAARQPHDEGFEKGQSPLTQRRLSHKASWSYWIEASSQGYDFVDAFGTVGPLGRKA